MNFLDDKKIRKIAQKENVKASDKYSKLIDATLENLIKEEKQKNNIKPLWGYTLKFATAIVLASFILLPNISPKISYAMQQWPIVGNIVKVITIKNYFDKEGNSELNAEVPNIENDDGSKSESNETINEDVKALTQKFIDQYYFERNPENHFSIEIKPHIITNSNKWFTLKLTIIQTLASSDVQYKYYHLDKRTDKIIKLSDLFINEDYKDAISTEIKRQMISKMKENDNIVYWFDEESKEWSFRRVDNEQNFYFSENGNIVIVFDKYEVGPGSSGAPEFEIDKKVYEKFLKEDFK